MRWPTKYEKELICDTNDRWTRAMLERLPKTLCRFFGEFEDDGLEDQLPEIFPMYTGDVDEDESTSVEDNETQ